MDTTTFSFDELLSLLHCEQERQDSSFNETMQNVNSFQSNESMRILEEYAAQNNKSYPTYSHA